MKKPTLLLVVLLLQACASTQEQTPFPQSAAEAAPPSPAPAARDETRPLDATRLPPFEGERRTVQEPLRGIRKIDTTAEQDDLWQCIRLGFAKGVEPGNSALAAREVRDRRLREAGKPTLPSRLGEERATNPFLRCGEPAVVESASKYLGARVADPVRVFAAIREWKNKT